MMKRKTFWFSLIFCGLMAVAGYTAVTPLDALPPVPRHVLTNILQQKHPFILGTRDGFRNTEDRFDDPLFEDLYEHFEIRVEGYVQKKSPWFLGEGPLSTNEAFHPRFLEDEDALAYHQALCELMMYQGLESERWAVKRLEREFLRQLQELKQEASVGFFAGSNDAFTLQEARLLASASLIYDVIYNRVDTIERHELSRQIKQIRDRMAQFCSSVNPYALLPEERVTYGTALGLSTLMCLSVYRDEWQGQFSAQSYLPDLYRAISFTRSGMKDMTGDGSRLQVSLNELQQTLLLGIPWMESLKRLGYTMVLERGSYANIYKAIDRHRLPGSLNLVIPTSHEGLRDPWVPKTVPLFWKVDDRMYEKDQSSSSMTFAQIQENETVKKVNQETSIGLPENLPQRQSQRFNQGGQPLTLKEMLNEFGLPKQPPQSTPTPTPPPATHSEKAGWSKPKGLLLPPMWGALFHLASLDRPASQAQAKWEELASEIDSHPYAYHYYKIVNEGFVRHEENAALLNYPKSPARILAFESSRDSFMFAAQSANATIAAPTYTMDHESFLMQEDETQWRWLHEGESIPEQPASKPDFDASYGEVIKTVLFTTWTTYSPRGRTQIVRRHERAIGGAYTVVAHFPDSATSSPPLTNVVFQLPGETQAIMGGDVPEQLRLMPEGAQNYSGPMGVDDWRRIRRAERAGFIERKHVGVLDVLFAPNVIKGSGYQEGMIGSIYDVELKNPQAPFFYLMSAVRPNRSSFDIKYSGLPIDDVRLVEWNNGIDLIAVTDGTEKENPFVHTDAELVMIIRDRSMEGLFYLMVNGTYLRVKLSPTQEDYVLLVDTKGKRISAAWSRRKIHLTRPPNAMSRFYAPNVVGVECPGQVIDYGQKGGQVVVWGHKSEEQHASARRR